MNLHNNTRRIIALIVIALGLCIIFLNGRHDLPTDSSRWQAVFLEDGQVYFGRLSSYNQRFALLDQVYYLKLSSGLQQGAASELGGQLNLIKLGGEAHGPEGKMYIAKDNILFVENLKDDSAVVRAISRSK
jgi:hypothetical protein